MCLQVRVYVILPAFRNCKAMCGVAVSTAPFSLAMRPTLLRFRSRTAAARSDADFFHHAMVTP